MVLKATMRIDYCMVVLDLEFGLYALALLVSQYIVCSPCPWAVAALALEAPYHC